MKVIGPSNLDERILSISFKIRPINRDLFLSSEFNLRLNNQPSLLSGDHHRLPGAESQRFQPSPLEGELRQRVRLALVGSVANPVIMRLRLADGGCGDVLL